MNIPMVALLGYLALALDLGLAPALALGRPDGGIAPSFVMPLVVFVAMHSLTLPALWFALAMGAALDLTGPIATGDGGTVVSLGPMAIACFAAAYVVLQVRGAVVRRNPISLMALTVLGAMVASIVAVPILSFRSLYADHTGFSLHGELLRRVLASIYTGVPALVLAWPMTYGIRAFGFQDATTRRYARRS